mgnify:CR=1 FL=1
MRVAGLDKNNDFRFGRGLASYLSADQAIRQNVATRIKSFRRDWVLNTDANIDWIDLLGRKNSRDKILREIERVVLSTTGVLRIITLDASQKDRNMTISLTFETVYGSSITDNIGVAI